MWPVTVPTLPMSGAIPQPMLLLMCHVWMLLLLRRFRPPLQPALVAGDLKSICKILDVFLTLKVLKTVPSSGDTAGFETRVPSDSDDVVDHESCSPTCSIANDVDDKNSRSDSTSETMVLDHGTGDAATQPSCDSINSNDTTCSDLVSVTGVEKDPADISNINKNIKNSVNDSNDNNVIGDR